jgi:hypothetical protein
MLQIVRGCILWSMDKHLFEWGDEMPTSPPVAVYLKAAESCPQTVNAASDFTRESCSALVRMKCFASPRGGPAGIAK